MCYVVRVASSGKVWCFFVFFQVSEGLSSSFFAAISPTFLRFGILHCMVLVHSLIIRYYYSVLGNFINLVDFAHSVVAGFAVRRNIQN